MAGIMSSDLEAANARRSAHVPDKIPTLSQTIRTEYQQIGQRPTTKSLAIGMILTVLHPARVQEASLMKTSLRLRRAATMAGVCPKTLLRASRIGRLTLLKHPLKDRWIVSRQSLWAAPILSLGQAARRLGIHIETARRWIKRGKLKAIRQTPEILVARITKPPRYPQRKKI